MLSLCNSNLQGLQCLFENSVSLKIFRLHWCHSMQVAVERQISQPGHVFVGAALLTEALEALVNRSNKHPLSVSFQP